MSVQNENRLLDGKVPGTLPEHKVVPKRNKDTIEDLASEHRLLNTNVLN